MSQAATINSNIQSETLEIDAIFSEQQKAFRAQPFPEAKQRIADLKKLKRVLVDYQMLRGSRECSGAPRHIGGQPSINTPHAVNAERTSFTRRWVALIFFSFGFPCLFSTMAPSLVRLGV